MNTGVLLLALIGFANLYAPSRGTIQTQDAVMSAIDSDLVLVIAVANQSSLVADKISGTLRHIPPKERRRSTLNHDCTDSCIKHATQLLGDAITSSKRYAVNDMQEMDPDIRVSRLLDAKVTLLEFVYPEIQKSNTKQRGPFSVMFWLCPDRATAVALFWLRRGGRIMLANKTPTVVEPSSKSRLHSDAGSPGDMAYSYDRRLMINVPVKKTDPLALPDRVGFVAHHFVVEVETQTFFRNGSDADWVTIGMSDIDRSEAFAVLRHIAGSLQVEAR